MKIDLVFIAYNRLSYTKLALASILADSSEEFALTIWDNASTDGTVEYLKNEVSDPRIAEIIFSKENVGQTAAVNEIWGKSKADLLGKLDNDCLVTAGWTRTLARAHADIPQLGVVACWHFFPEDFDYDRAKRKIQRFGEHQVLRHPWTCGTGLLFKKETFERFGPISGKATTGYWLKLALAGYVNGFYYPLIYQEHMDDPRSQYNEMLHAPFTQAYRHTVGYTSGKFDNPQTCVLWQKEILDNLLAGPYDPRYYCGWGARARRLARRVRGFLGRVGGSGRPAHR